MSEARQTFRPIPWLDMKIPLWGIATLVVGLLLQSASLLIWGARIDERLSQNTIAIADLQLKAANVASLRETVARIDERTQAMVVVVNRLDEERAK